ncbi:hypothetical protein GCM10010967_36190 [Dyadobacter beijingensis]|uniref:Uncharacterized protein n=1 Tax=Dyadobacter beijingensis TaxID=365489 RepID=A0ABQ2I426_9BACT|nr:hypothetical protein [Dyadobacter beijingensis]GGM98983.1 hypothetical protein GCM10010967_36190 [Dyadobacter beijingensis]
MPLRSYAGPDKTIVKIIGGQRSAVAGQKRITMNINFLSPLEGDVFHAFDGHLMDGKLQIAVQIAASTDAEIAVNGAPATWRGDHFEAEVILDAYANTLRAENLKTGESAEVRVFLLQDFAGHYRLSIDDNIWFLRDIQQNRYASLFENPYLGFLKEINVGFGTKIHLNLFYQTDGFNLSDFTDQYKAEWKANADWLRLSFHAYQEFPDMPYVNAGYDEVKRDCDLIMGEIRRFAGAEVMHSVTTIHWGEATVEGSRAMRDAGYVGQVGYFNVDDHLPSASYYLTADQRRHLKKRFVWHDTAEDITFVRASIVIDTKKLEDIRPHLDAHGQNGHKPPYLDLLVHEQYFYPFYFNYQPDFRDKIRTAVQWAKDNGYTPQFLTESISHS